MGDQEGEILHPERVGLAHRHGIGRRRGLEPDGEEHHLRPGSALATSKASRRRVDHPDVAALGPRSQQVVLRAGTRSMSPKEHSVVPGTRAKWMAWSMIARA